MQSLIQRLASFTRYCTGSRSSVNRQELADFVESLQRDAKSLQIQFNGSDARYTCALAGYDHDHEVVVLNNFYPKPSLAELSDQSSITLSAEDDGQRLVVTGRYLEPLIAGDYFALLFHLDGYEAPKPARIRLGRSNPLVRRQLRT